MKLMIYELRIEELEQQLADAEKVIKFYGDEYDAYNEMDLFYSEGKSLTGGKRARQYLDKYKSTEVIKNN